MQKIFTMEYKKLFKDLKRKYFHIRSWVSCERYLWSKSRF